MLSQMFRGAHGRGSAHSGEVRLALEAADIPSFWRTIHEAQGELRRCRRYEHPLSLLVVGVESAALEMVARSEGGAGDPDAWFLRRFECAALLVLGWILRDATREIDSVSYAAESHMYVVVLPETEAVGARAAARRLSDLFEKRASVSLTVGVAAFPVDGLTVEDLFHQASSTLADWRAATPEGVQVDDSVAARAAGSAATSSLVPATSAHAPPPPPVSLPVSAPSPLESTEVGASSRRTRDVPVIAAATRQHRRGPGVRRASNG